MSKAYAKYSDPSSLEAVAHRMRILRRALGGEMSQKAFCELVGSAPSAWANYESGAAMPNVHLIMSMSDRFGVCLRWVYHGKENGLRTGSPKEKALLGKILQVEAEMETQGGKISAVA